jgi:hypothetical protein
MLSALYTAAWLLAVPISVFGVDCMASLASVGGVGMVNASDMMLLDLCLPLTTRRISTGGRLDGGAFQVSV